jgi:hypothetical protein
MLNPPKSGISRMPDTVLTADMAAAYRAVLDALNIHDPLQLAVIEEQLVELNREIAARESAGLVAPYGV